MQVMYDRHEAFGDFINSDDARESLLRHISVAAMKPGEFGDEQSSAMESQRPRVTRREEDSSMVGDLQFRAESMGGYSRHHGNDPRRVETAGNQGPENHGLPMNTALKFSGSQLETLTGGGELARADFVTDRGGLDESMVLMPQSTSQLDQYSHHLNSSSINDESQMYPPGYGDGNRRRMRPNQSNRHLSTRFP